MEAFSTSCRAANASGWPLSEWSTLPPEILEQIVCRNLHDFTVCFRVCTVWYAFCNTDGVGVKDDLKLLSFMKGNTLQTAERMVAKVRAVSSRQLASLRVMLFDDLEDSDTIASLFCAQAGNFCNLTTLFLMCPNISDWTLVRKLPETLTQLYVGSLAVKQGPCADLSEFNRFQALRVLSLTFQLVQDRSRIISVRGDLCLPCLQELQLGYEPATNKRRREGFIILFCFEDLKLQRVPSTCAIMCTLHFKFKMPHIARTRVRLKTLTNQLRILQQAGLVAVVMRSTA